MKSIERVPVVQQVVSNIQEFISSGAVKVGQKLPTEKELCEELAVGRSTLREALRILQANNLVEIKPGRGAFVAHTKKPDPDNILEWFAQNEVELKDCLEVRTAIEPLSIKLAIARCTDADIAQLTKIHVLFVEAVEKHNVAAIAKYDERFHNLIVEKSNNKLLISINKKVSEYILVFRSKTFQIEQNAQHAIEPHSNIMKALEERDVDAGELFMRKHLQRVFEDMTKMIVNK